MVKQGYKQTQIGVIPEDWEVRHLDDLGKVTSGGTPSTSVKQYWDGNISWCTPSDITSTNGKYIYNTERKITESGLKNSAATILPPNSLMLCTRATIGELKINTVPMATNQGFKNINTNALCNVSYLYYLLQTKKKSMIELAIGSTFLEISKSALCSIPLQTAPLPEQQRIAEALSDVDSMIFSLEKLIAKKKAIKQGAMQELLTGKKRLPGFTEEWIEKKVEEIVIRIATGLNPRQNFKLNNGGTNYYVTIKDFKNGRLYLDDACDRIDDIALKKINERSDLRKGDLLFSSIGRIGDAYLITDTPQNWNINESVFTLRANDELIHPKMLYYILTSQSVKQKLIDSTTGSTLKSIKLGHLKSILCRFPKAIDEQLSIAILLSDMDKEIEALEQKLAKTRQIKQGMMQQLLTGKIRLVAEEKATAAISTTEQTDLPHSRSRHNQQFDDAVMIAAIVNAFYSEKYPLGRKKVQKLLYLLRRKQQEDISAFKKKAAGPYADEVRYKGGEPIARKQGYITTTTTQKGTAFAKGKAIDVALSYIGKWQMQSDIDWLVSTFKYTNTNDLELYATIDMAICDLQHEGIAVSVDSVKDLIRSNKEWKAKLTKTYFSDADIARAIDMCKRLFPFGRRAT